MTDNERLYPTDDEKKRAGQILKDIIFNGITDSVAEEEIREWFTKYWPGFEATYAKMVDPTSNSMPAESLPQLAVDMFHIRLFDGKPGGELRDIILHNMLYDERPAGQRQLRSIYLKANKRLTEDDKEDVVRNWPAQKHAYVNELTNHKRYPWHPGGGFARSFVRELGLPEIFSGIPNERKLPVSEDIETRTPYHKLASFQANMYLQILEILNGNTSKKRAIITLPTGAGKTKTTVEALIESWKHNDFDYILWIAQNQELCEQALACVRQIWEEKGDGESLRIFRTFGSRPLPSEGERGIIIGGVSQLNEYVKDYSLARIAENGRLGAVVIDEAHHSYASTYRSILKCLGIKDEPKDEEKIPLLGLTATPERSTEYQTKVLRRIYGNRRIHPAPGYGKKHDPELCDGSATKDSGGRPFDKKWENLLYMKDRLEQLKYLAHAKYEFFDPKMDRDEQTMNVDEDDEYDNDPMNKIPTTVIDRLGQNAARNKNTFNELKKWADKGRQILFFGANLNQSITMSKFLQNADIPSETIIGETPYGARRTFIKRFKDKDIQVLCNYEVLATGFDSPEIDTLMIARPTSSKIVYEQMVGRGLRGTTFGGTEDCTIITVKDNIYRFGGDRVDLGYDKYHRDLEDED